MLVTGLFEKNRLLTEWRPVLEEPKPFVCYIYYAQLKTETMQ